MNENGWPAAPLVEIAAGQEIKGKAFSVPFKVLALLLVEGIAWWGYVLWSHGKLGSTELKSTYWLIAALLLLCITVFYVFRSITSISATHIKQSWMWDKEMLVSELAYAKLIHIKGLDWLIAPRMYARSHGGKFATFYSSNAHVIQQFEKLCLQLKLK
jgi:hypothetical protein